MFDADPIVWMQSWASPVLTGVMNGISLLGYTRAYIAISTLLAFGFWLRPAIALLVLIALSGAFTDMAKAAGEAPRPSWVDMRVQSLSLFARELRARDTDTPTEMEDSYGFPSGHVSASATFAFGLALLLGAGRRGWTAALVWVALMALSRMYLGRHFLADTIGGVVIGLAVLGVAYKGLKIDHLAGELRAQHPWAAHRTIALAAVLAAGALLVGFPDAGDAGRLLGTAVGVLVLVDRDVFAIAPSARARAILLTASAAGFAAAWSVMTYALRDAEPSSVSAFRLIASALPNAALLVVPAILPRRLVFGTSQREFAPSGSNR